MKLFAMFLAVILSTFAPAGYAKTKALSPDAMVKALYETNETPSNPFFQTKNRALLDRYFIKDLADLIWKDALSAQGDLGALDYNPLFGSQDPQITNLKIMESGLAADINGAVWCAA